MQSELHVDTIERAGWSDVYLTYAPRSPLPSAEALEAPFARLASALAERRVGILQEKIYGPRAAEPAIMEARRRAFEGRGIDPDTAPTFLEGEPCVGGLLAGVQIVGAVPSNGEVWIEPVERNGVVVGRELVTPGHRMLYLGGVSGFDPQRGRCVGSQADWMLRNAGALLEARGMRPEHVLRTWIYLPRLLDWYGEFNRVRTACFRDFGILDAEGKGVLPASTGIQGRRIEGEECFMDVLAVAREDGSRAEARPMNNVRQNEAYEYGSSFSRGMALSLGGPPTLYVSGTASINGAGSTIYHGDSQGQVTETLLDVAALLEGSGAKLSHLRHATAYCKRPADFEAFQRIVEQLELEHIPFVPVKADVCRDELLFEVDAVAVPETR